MLHFELFLALSAVFCVVSALTLKSNLYFGTRSRKPRTIQTSLLWTEANSVDRLRYECRHEDDFDTFGWLEHNGYNYGKQQLRDTNNGINMYTEFVETTPNNWALRVTGLPLNPDYVYDARNISVFFAVTVQGEKSEISYSRITKKMEKNGISGNTAFYGSSIDIGDFAVYIPENKNNTYPTRAQTERTPLESYPGIYKKRKIDSSIELENTQYYGTRIKEEDQWKMKHEILYKSKKGIDTIHENVQATLGPIENNLKLKNMLEKAFNLPQIPILPNTIEENSNVLVLQKLPFQLEFVFSTNPDSYSSYQVQPKILPKSIEELSGSKLTTLLSQKSEEFHMKFDETFKLREKKQFTLSEIQMAQFAISNLIGSITYFYGDTIQAVIKPGETKTTSLIKTTPGELLTGVPSRSFFPRGFFWDEGFQQILVLYWNSSLSLDVISSWMNRQEDNGWIEREQILGDESRSKVPEKFQVQSPLIANPPTFFISIHQMVKEIKNTMKNNGIEIDKNTNEHHNVIIIPDHIKAKITDISKHLERYLSYLETSQESSIIPNTFAWSQRTADHVLPSGFDDFPRGLQPSYEDRHVDLHSWILYSNKIMIELSEYLGESSKSYQDKYDHYFKILYDEYFNKERGLFSDYGMIHLPPPTATSININNDLHGFVNHDGYPTILPLLLGLIPKNNDEVKNILELIRDPSKLWSSYGLRSLSANDTYYGKGENYWRGSIWLNMNYLTLQSLYNNYMSDDCIYKKLATSIYNELRSNIILLVSKEFKRSGYIWEHYDAKTGYGKGTHPFTGWSSLILLIMSEIY